MDLCGKKKERRNKITWDNFELLKKTTLLITNLFQVVICSLMASGTFKNYLTNYFYCNIFLNVVICFFFVVIFLLVKVQKALRNYLLELMTCFTPSVRCIFTGRLFCLCFPSHTYHSNVTCILTPICSWRSIQ